MKHAYLLMIHKEPYNLQKLLELLDDVNNDIYIHIDVKSKILCKEEILKWCKKSNLYFVQSISVQWAAYSGIKCEMVLLEEAVKGKYDYYHLLSGQDLPLTSQKNMQCFFEENKGKEFVSLYDRKDLEWRMQALYERVCYWHLNELADRFSSKFMKNLVELVSKVWLKVQKILHIKRQIKIEEIAFGKNWFSITDNFAQYVLAHKEEIEKIFKYTASGDEIFLQYMLVKSPYKDNNYLTDKDSSMRYVDWTRSVNKANPHVWETKEFDELINSGYLFARKFDSDIDREIIDQIYNYVKNQDIA